MADEADIAGDIERTRLDALILNRERHLLPATGHCYNCGEPIPVGLFCDADCRDDYDKRKKLDAMKPRHDD
ncbi:DUF2116 family Zn-ribbon domain-containing protein [Salmonella enterica subsp. enterica serovar Mountpleasant]|nr:DUF2116 family Zn-ribbon domain-containing protein [Salmonella enterica subsp. enterica serovar Mountpleasant]